MKEPKIKGGYILLSRGLIESEIFKKPPLYLKVWIYLLSKAQHKDFKALKRGQLWTDIPEIQEACSWYVGYRKEKPSKKQIYTILEWLRNPYERDNEGTAKGTMIGTTKGTQGMLVNIDKYRFYQDSKNYEGNDEGNDERTAKELRREEQGNNINKNDKNVQECNNNDNNIYCPNSVEFRLADYLFRYIKRNNEKAKEPNLQKWSKVFDCILRIDKRDIEEVKSIIKWCQNDSFWFKNILSPDKLRKQYDRLLVSMKDPKPKEKREDNFNNYEQRKYDYDDLEKKLLGWNEEGE
ncbi:hypothetical protein KYB31_15535 [Clostridium felsineum]|uniref:hypothetical protein n=1 Tax=Clostridium felsineum TaxID=36839 RepID=UPI00214DE399|nr:hypothetical protein [Clostridium felsineum]MCR3760389.1 hypothetical protein [Clostridium felsineum]